MFYSPIFCLGTTHKLMARVVIMLIHVLWSVLILRVHLILSLGILFKI